MASKWSKRPSIIGERAPIFWGACAAIGLGVVLHLPMLAMAHSMGNHLAGMPMDAQMWFGMALIILGVPAAIYGALPKHRTPHGSHAGTNFEAPDTTPLNRWHAAVLLVLTLGLIIDVMKPATLGFVIPGMRGEYGLDPSTAAILPLRRERRGSCSRAALACGLSIISRVPASAIGSSPRAVSSE